MTVNINMIPPPQGNDYDQPQEENDYLGGEELPVDNSDSDSDYTPDKSGASDVSDDEYDVEEDENPPRRPGRQATPRQ